MRLIENNGNKFKQPAMGMYTAVGDVRQGLQNYQGVFQKSWQYGASLVGIGAMMYTLEILVKNISSK